MGELNYGKRIVKPLPQGVSYLIEILKTKPTVKHIKVFDEQILEIIRKENYSTIKLYIVDAYVLGEGATLEILNKYPDINTILVLSNWNEYTNAAKLLANEKKVGLFTFSEFMGAIYYDGESYINYMSSR